MSGVYLVVWSPEDKEKSPVLLSTTGGYPHITVAYTGELLPRHDLIDAACRIFKTFLPEAHITEAYVNSFFQEKAGKWRHDVLMRVDANTTALVAHARYYLMKQFSTVVDKFFMSNPHITHSTHETKEEAEAECAKMNAIFKNGPYPCIITGVTID